MKIVSLLDGKEINIIDNFLSSDLANKVYEQLSARNFPYYFSEKTLDESIKKSYFDKKTQRARANFAFNTPKLDFD